MARKSEHNIRRKLNDCDRSHNSFITITDAIFNSYMVLLNDPLITEDIAYQEYQKLLLICERKKERVLKHQSNIKKGLLQSSLTEDYLKEDFHSKLIFKEKRQEYLITDIEKFLAYQIKFSITSENIISSIFDIDILYDKLDIATFKDNASNSCSDKIVLFNLAMLLIVNKTSDTPFPYPILDKCYTDELNYSETFSDLTEELLFLYGKLNNFYKEKGFKSIYTIFSEECILLFLADRKKTHALHNYCIFCKNAIEYLKYERKYLLKQIKLQKYNFVKLFLPLIGMDMNDNKEHWSVDIKKYYKNIIHEYESLCDDINACSTKLYNLYCHHLSKLLDKDNNLEHSLLINDLQETVHVILNALAESDIEDKSLLYIRYVTILSNLTPANNLHKFIELLYNICAPDNDNITDLAINIFAREYDSTVFEYSQIPENELINLLNSCYCSLSMAEDIMRFFSIYICNEDDWTFICSLLACQNHNPDWFSRFYEIIRNIRGISFKDFNSILYYF